jgi:hypothetical protein
LTVRPNVPIHGHRDQAPKTCACCGTIPPPDARLRTRGGALYCNDKQACAEAYLVAVGLGPTRRED